MNFSYSPHVGLILTFAMREAYSIHPYSISARAEMPKHIPWSLLIPYFIIGLPIIALLGYLIGVSIKRYMQAKEKKRKDAVKLSELSPEELERLYGGNFPDEFASIDKMSREELKLLAKKELEKQGRKPGEVDYRKGPLDWEDVDENFRPRPKVIRSDISKIDIEKTSRDEEEKSKKDNNDVNLSTPPEIPE